MFANGLRGLHFLKGEKDDNIFVLDTRDNGGEKNSSGDLSCCRVTSLNESLDDG